MLILGSLFIIVHILFDDLIIVMLAHVRLHLGCLADFDGIDGVILSISLSPAPEEETTDAGANEDGCSEGCT